MENQKPADLIYGIEDRPSFKDALFAAVQHLLAIFVAIPLPGTGAWTGALVAAFLDMRLKKALPSIAGGVLSAGLIISILSYGVKSFF